MIPSAAAVNGTEAVEATEANTPGNPVQSNTIAKINQAWLASRTGLSACSIRRRRARARSSLAAPASGYQKPAPKSAPPSRAYAVSEARTTAMVRSAALK
jgi:hypothetical protein